MKLKIINVDEDIYRLNIFSEDCDDYVFSGYDIATTLSKEQLYLELRKFKYTKIFKNICLKKFMLEDMNIYKY